MTERWLVNDLNPGLRERETLDEVQAQAAYWKRQYKAAEKAKLLACGYADQAETRLRTTQEAFASSLADAHNALSWVRQLHRPSGAAVCQECGRDWPCATIRAVGDSV